MSTYKRLDEAKDGEKIDIDSIDIDEILKNVKDIEDLKKVLREIVSQKVVKDVTKNILASDDAPTFGNLDEKLAKIGDNVIQNSVVMTVASKIFKEAYREDKNADPDVATQKALVEYCVYQLSRVFKQTPRVDIFKEYDISPSDEQLYQEGYFLDKWAEAFVDQLLKVKDSEMLRNWKRELNTRLNDNDIIEKNARYNKMRQIVNKAKIKAATLKKHWIKDVSPDKVINAEVPENIFRKQMV